MEALFDDQSHVELDSYAAHAARGLHLVHKIFGGARGVDW